MTPKATFSLGLLQDTIANILHQVQGSLANHKKNCVTLYKLHIQAASHIESTSKSSVKLVGEHAFQDAILDMVSRVLVVKKGVASADRIVKFIGSYVKYINDKARMEKAHRSVSSGKHVEPAYEDDEDEDTFVSRFVSRLLGWLLRGFLAKDKNVRYRSVYLVSEMILWLGNIDVELYDALRENLIERLCDKEAFIRAQSVVALARLSGTEDPNEIREGEKSIEELLTDILIYDHEPEVRRAALLNLPLNRTTVDTLVSCSRDVDLLTRKLLYSAVLCTKLNSPRSLTLVQREKVIRDGLGDREASVRAVASKLIMRWFEFILAENSNEPGGSWKGDDGGIMKACVRFLELFDIIGNEEVALEALKAIFVLKPQYLEVFAFSDAYWTNLTPESAALARTFIEHNQGETGANRIEQVGLPMVTAFAFYVQSFYNTLLEALQAVEKAEMLRQNEEEATEAMENLHKAASILSSILSIATKLDYGDEIGRRKAFCVIKDMLTHPALPLDLVAPCMDVMSAMLTSERELIRVTVEIIIDLRDGEEEETTDTSILEKSFADTTMTRERSFKKPKDRHQMSKEEREVADFMDMRCLVICNAVLERVNGPFEDNSTLQGILDDLIIPTAQRKEMILREKALTALGLCSLIAKRMALGSFQLFSNECMRAPSTVRVTILKTIFDLLLLYEKEFFGKSEEMDTKLVAFLLSIMENELAQDEPFPEVLAILCVGFAKLLLLGIVNDPKMLLCLLVAYVSPDTAENQEVRQCLSYFFARYSVAHPRNKIRLQSIFLNAFDTITKMSESVVDGQSMISPEKFGEMLLIWTDPKFGPEDMDRTSVKDNHANVAIDLLLAMYDSERPDAELRIFCHLLNQQLYWPDDINPQTLHMIDVLLCNHEVQSPFDSAATTKALDRFRNRFNKMYSKQLANIDPRRFVHDDEVRKLYEAINVDIPDSEDESADSFSLSRRTEITSTKESRVSSIASTGTDVVDDGEMSRASTADFERGVHKDSLDTVSSTTVTPKKGKKRLRAPGSGGPTPTERKRNRADVSIIPRASDTEPDGNITPTPVKLKTKTQMKPPKPTNSSKQGIKMVIGRPPVPDSAVPLTKQSSRTRSRQTRKISMPSQLPSDGSDVEGNTSNDSDVA